MFGRADNSNLDKRYMHFLRPSPPPAAIVDSHVTVGDANNLASPYRKNVSHYVDDAMRGWSPSPTNRSHNNSSKSTRKRFMDTPRDSLAATVERKLASAYIESIQNDSIRLLTSCPSRRLSRSEFNQILTKLNVYEVLTVRDLKHLDEKYYNANDGNIDVYSFKHDFIVLGKALHRSIKDKEARDAFRKRIEASATQCRGKYILDVNSKRS